MSPGIIGTYLALAGYAARRLTRRRRPRTTRTCACWHCDS
jgi:hypothetical protein